MDNCDHHPLVAAGWRCEQCARDFCDECIAQNSEDRYRSTCLLCDAELIFLGGAADAEPFWRRLQASFRYPLTSDAGSLIVVGALLATVAAHLPFFFAIPLSLIAAGVVMKYAFNCLQATAQGRLLPPNMVDSYSGGILLLFQLLIMMIVVMLLIGSALYFLGPGFGGLIALAIVALLPAMVMMFAVEDSLLSGLNLRSAWRLAGAVGMPYGVLLGLLMVMSSSVAVIAQLLGGFTFVAQALQAAVSNYYTIVMFHIMGYVLFQYQRELGYVAARDDGAKQVRRTERQLIDARLDALVKAGHYEDVLAVFRHAVKRFPADRELARRCLQFLLATRDAHHLGQYASAYFEQALRRGDPDPLAPAFHAVRALIPDFVPDTAEVRVALAKALHERGEARVAAQLLNGLHKDFPRYEGLSGAYELMAEVLDRLPKMAAQAEKYRAFAAKLAARKQVPAST